MVRPNHYDCEECPDWDEVNGCWRDCTVWCGWTPDDEYEGEEFDEEEEASNDVEYIKKE